MPGDIDRLNVIDHRQHVARALEDPAYASMFSPIAHATLNTLLRPRPRTR